MDAKKIICYSTIFMLFGSAFRIGDSNYFQLFYLVILINTTMMMLMRRLWVPTGLVLLFVFICSSGAIGILRHTDTFPRVAKEVIGISIEAFYFCCFFKTFDFKMEELFRLYARMAYWIGWMGFLLFGFYYYTTGEPRLKSILTEPSMIGFTCVPALYYFADQWQRKRIYGKELVVLSLAVLASQSSTAYLGVMFGSFLFCMRYRRTALLAPLLVCLLGFSFYLLSDSFRERFSGSYETLTTSSVDSANVSTYVLYTNFFVMEQVLQEHPILGNGIGSHGESFMRYIGFFPANPYNGRDNEYSNAEDASSLGTRVLSDFGISGAILVLLFIWHFRPRGRSEIDNISKSIWIYFFISIVRGGIYFNNEMYFFICFYALGNYVSLSRAQTSNQWASEERSYGYLYQASSR